MGCLSGQEKSQARRGLSDYMAQGSQPWWRHGVCGDSKFIAKISQIFIPPCSHTFPTYFATPPINCWSVFPHPLILNLALWLALANDVSNCDRGSCVYSFTLAPLPLPWQYAQARLLGDDTWSWPAWVASGVLAKAILEQLTLQLPGIWRSPSKTRTV